MFCHSIGESQEDSSNKIIKIECNTYSKFNAVLMYQIPSNEIDDYLQDLQETMDCFPNTTIRINQIPISSNCTELLLNP
jgi:hypothetical protein